MIIKSMSRKSGSFPQLYDYLMREKEAFSFTHNLYASPTDRQAILREFYENASFIEKSRGKNVLYHEMLSLPTNELESEQEKKILMELVRSYIELRSNNHLVFGAMHQDKEHLHVHLMVSANEIEGTKRVRLSKKQFADIQQAVETYKNEKYPELSSSHYEQHREKQNTGRTEQEIRHRRKKQTRKDELHLKLEALMKQSYQLSNFIRSLRDLGMDYYERGKTAGVVYEGKKYRLKTLGLESEYKELLQKSARREADKEVRKEKRARAKQGDYSKQDPYHERMDRLRKDSHEIENDGWEC